MKAIDFTQPGGFPLTQDQLGYLQTAYTECINALAAMGGDGPFTVSGCVVTKTLVSGTTYNYSITPGWVYYEGNMIRVPAIGLAGINESTDAAYMLISPAALPLTYNDGSTPNVIFDSSISLTALPTGTTDDSTRFLLSELVPFGVGFGNANKESAWNTLVVNTPSASGGVTGNIYYRKNFLTNTLQLRGFLDSANAQNFAASPFALYYSMGTLPTEYRPTSVEVPFIASYAFANLIKDDLGISWIKQVNGIVNSASQILINWLRPDSAIAGYGILFDATLTLD